MLMPVRHHLAQVLHFLYEKDILEDSAILPWMEEEGMDAQVKAAIR